MMNKENFVKTFIVHMDNTFYIRFSDPTAFSAKARENLRDLYIVKGT